VPDVLELCFEISHALSTKVDTCAIDYYLLAQITHCHNICYSASLQVNSIPCWLISYHFIESTCRSNFEICLLFICFSAEENGEISTVPFSRV